MRVVAWNILDGGVGRADPIAEVLLAQRPDLVALVEADDQSVIDRLASRLRATAVRGQARKGTSAAILSRFDFVHTINHAALHEDGPRSCLEARLRDPDGREWDVFAVHLSARATLDDEQRRLVELSRLLEITAPRRRENRPHLLLGDFNSNSPVQHFDPASAHPRTREAYQANGNVLPRMVVQRLLDEGYLDTLHAVLGDRARSLMSFTTLHPGQRLDYVFAWGMSPGHLHDAWIEHDSLARYASDHFPVGATLD
jgi:endonuclease/exonuclease/phosphatase family metal-dependent hydrolase